MKACILSLFFFLFVFVTAEGQPPNEMSDQQLKRLGEIAEKDVPENAPGIATGVVLNGEIVYEHYAGYADLKNKALIDGQSRFNIASNGKQFTALAILILEEEKKLDLQDDLRKYYPSIFPDIKSPILIKHLLNHSSGIRDVYNLWALKGITWWKQSYDIKTAMALLHQQMDLNFRPGSEYAYSNSNYMLLAGIVEKVTGLSFVDYTSNLFQALGMPNTSFVTDYNSINGTIALPYFNFNKWVGYAWKWNIAGDGNLFSSLKDQLRWEKIIQTGSCEAISASVLAKSQTLVAHSAIENYGFGLSHGTYKNMAYTFHDGATGAWKASTVRFKTDNLSVVTLTNSGKTDPKGQTLQMIDYLLKLKTTRDFLIAPEKVGVYVAVEDLLGTYQTNDGYIMKFEQRNGDLYMLRSGKNDIKLNREADNVFQQWNDPPFKQAFTKNEKGEMQITAYYPTVPPFTLVRIESDFRNYNFKALNGKYENKETAVKVEINYSRGETYEVKLGKQNIQATLVSPKELIVEDYRVIISNDKNGQPKELFLSAGRIQNVRFVRVE